MKKPFACDACPLSYGRPDRQRHLSTAHKNLKPFQCVVCPKNYGRKHHLIGHVKSVHEGLRPYACPVCNVAFPHKCGLNAHAVLHTRVEGIECPVCHIKFKNKHVLRVHKSKRHSVTEPLGLKRKVLGGKEPVESSAACPSPPSKRAKKEPPSAEGIAGKDVEDLLIIAEGAEHGYDATKKEPGIEASDVEAAMKSEDDNIVDSPALVLRLRTTVTVKFKTSSGRVRTAEDQPASMTYGDFRKLFGIPHETPKRIEFMKSVDQWTVAVDDNMKLPLVDGRVVAETCTDF